MLCIYDNYARCATLSSILYLGMSFGQSNDLYIYIWSQETDIQGLENA
jgi:hypothetical protein